MSEEQSVEYITVRECANLLGVSTAAIYQAIDSDRLPHTHQAGVRVVSKDDAEAYMTRVTSYWGIRRRGRPKGSRNIRSKSTTEAQ